MKYEWKKAASGWGLQKVAADGGIRAQRLALMGQLKSIASQLDPRVVPYLGNMAAANNLVVSASPKMDNPAVTGLVDQMVALDERFIRGMSPEEKASTLTAWNRAVEVARAGAAEIKAGLTPLEQQQAILREARAAKALNNAFALVGALAGGAALGATAPSAVSQLTGVMAPAGAGMSLMDMTDVGGNMAAMARQQTAEQYGSGALGQVEGAQQRLVKEKANRARQERIERNMAGGGGG